MSYRKKLTSAEDAVTLIRSGMRVFVSGNAATPTPLLEALAARKDELEGVELIHLLQMGHDPFAGPEMEGHFRRRSLFVGPADRDSVNQGRADYVPIMLHQVPWLFKRRVLPLDAAIVQVSPPDEHGFCSLGVEVIASKAALEVAPIVIAMVNPRMPRTLGDTFVHVSRLTAIVEMDYPLPELRREGFGEVERRIGEHVAGLIEDGATLQMGIGAIPDAVLASLEGRRDLGIHTEMISDGVVEALEKGLITGSRKTLHPGKIVGTFVLGSETAYRFVHDNPLFELHPADYVNDPFVIAQNRKMVAINSAIEVDLTGQVVADSIGTRIYSGFGGQLDFIRGAARSEGGKPHHRPPLHGQRAQPHRPLPEAGGRGGHHPGRRPLRGHRVGRGRALRPLLEGEGHGPHRDRPPRLPGGALPGRLGAEAFTPELPRRGPQRKGPGLTRPGPPS
jgi:Acetyl-CoA hydrolase